MTRAPRLLSRQLDPVMRGGRQMLRAALAVLVCAAPAVAETIQSAQFVDPTGRYTHGILGDAIEWGGLKITLSDGSTRQITLPQDHVFEDLAPRLVDLDTDGTPEVMVVETDVNAGAALAIYGPDGKITETPHIGTRNRWLAPLGAADLDGDGAMDVAFIDRPHLAKTLRIWRYENATLTQVAALRGVTNHRIGEVDIAGGIRTCNGTPEMILASANWSDLVAVRWGTNGFTQKRLGSTTTRAAFGQAMACTN